MNPIKQSVATLGMILGLGTVLNAAVNEFSVWTIAGVVASSMAVGWAVGREP